MQSVNGVQITSGKMQVFPQNQLGRVMMDLDDPCIIVWDGDQLKNI